MRLVCLLLAAAAVALSAPAAAHARDGDDDRQEARVEGQCGPGTSSRLRLRSRDGRIETRFEVRRRSRGERWRLTLSQEGRVVYRTTTRTRGGGSLRIERELVDLPGADTIVARGVGPRGRTCTAVATLSEG